MEQFTLENIRNVALLSHSGAGKTSLSEAILFNAKVINRLGRVDEGTTTSDYDPDEIQRKISINLTVLPYLWQGVKINLLDTPGYSDFVGEVKSALRVVEGAVDPCWSHLRYRSWDRAGLAILRRIRSTPLDIY